MDHLELVRVRELEVAVRVWHPEAPRTLVAWHGLARHGGDFAGLARELGPEWRILAPDTPGRGLSSWSLFPAHDYLYSHYMEVAVALLDHFALDRVAWLGTSMGGLLGMLLAADPEHGKRIERLILNDIGPEIVQEGLLGLGQYFGVVHRFTTFAALLEEMKDHYASFGIDDEASWQELALGSARRLPDGSWTYHYDPRIAEQFVHDTPRDTWADWQVIRCPLMVIRGEDSALLSAEIVERMRETQPSLVSFEVAGSGHAPMLDQPSQVAPIQSFLRRPAGAVTGPSPRPQPPIWKRLWQWLTRWAPLG